MKAFSLWLYRWCWRREIARELHLFAVARGPYGDDYTDGFRAGIEYALETLRLKESK